MTEETKVCSKCGLEKPLSDFYFDNSKNRHRNTCKQCWKEHNTKYRNENSSDIKEQRKLYRTTMDADKKNTYKKYWKMWSIENMERLREVKKIYAEKNKDRIKKYKKEWAKNNKSMVTPQRRISNILRVRVRKTIKNSGGKKYKGTISLVDCDVDYFIRYLESKFLPGMTWENYGFGDDKWHIDHIVPCASFDLTKPEEQLKCFHYTNLQPLWQHDNLSKHDKIQVLTSEGVFLV